MAFLLSRGSSKNESESFTPHRQMTKLTRETSHGSDSNNDIRNQVENDDDLRLPLGDDGTQPLLTLDSKFKKAKRGIMRGGKRSKNKKSLMFKAKPKSKLPPPDHFFKLPPELRNRVYMDVLCADTSTTGVRIITKGDDGEPSILRVCPQIREEALGIYYSLTNFVLSVEVEQLPSLERWISSIRERFDRPAEGGGPFYSVLPGPSIELRSVTWKQLGSLVSLAHLVQIHDNYLEIDDYGCEHWQLRVEIARRSNTHHEHRLMGAVKEIVELGQQAAKENWHEDWLDLEFEEWLEQKYDSVAARCRRALAGVAGQGNGLPGDWYGTDQPNSDDYDALAFGRGKNFHGVGTSDRKLRSQG